MTDKQCNRCGEVNPADIHTCSPNYVDRRQWKYDPMTGEPLIDGWPLYSGLPQPEPEPVAWYYAGSRVEPVSVALDCDLDAAQKANCTPLYTAPPQREWQGLTDEEVFAALVAVDGNTQRLAPGFVSFYCAIEAKLKEKNA